MVMMIDDGIRQTAVCGSIKDDPVFDTEGRGETILLQPKPNRINHHLLITRLTHTAYALLELVIG